MLDVIESIWGIVIILFGIAFVVFLFACAIGALIDHLPSRKEMKLLQKEIRDLQHKIDELETQNKWLTREKDNLSSETETQKRVINKLQKELASAKTSIEQLSSRSYNEFRAHHDISKLKNNIADLKKQINELTDINLQLFEENKRLTENVETINTLTEEQITQERENDYLVQENRDLKDIRLRLNEDIVVALSAADEKNFSKIIRSIKKQRLANAFDSSLSELKLESIEITARVFSSNKSEPYTAELNKWYCNCDDFLRNGNQPCKHLLYTAYSVGLLQTYRNEGKPLVQELINQTKKEKQKSQINI